jgi:hypothetical protein
VADLSHPILLRTKIPKVVTIGPLSFRRKPIGYEDISTQFTEEYVRRPVFAAIESVLARPTPENIAAETSDQHVVAGASQLGRRELPAH